MKERPIIFSSEMVRAILEGRKTQTRRVIKPQLSESYIFLSFIDDLNGKEAVRKALWVDDNRIFDSNNPFKDTVQIKCLYGQPGDRLWVRETFKLAGALFFRADGEPGREELELYPNWKWKPSIYMPRCFSRINLEVVNIRVERVQDISPEDVLAEGMPDGIAVGDLEQIKWFANLWDSINAKRGFSFEENKWVWVVEFKVVEEGA